jgi:hypothetical protein
MRRLFIAPLLFAAATLVAAETKPAATDYELRGFFGPAENIDISLRNTRTGNSRWYHLGDRAGGILVEKADAKTGTATIVVNGERHTLRIAGESVATAESEKEKSARTLRDWKTLNAYFRQWGQNMRVAQRATLKKAVVDLGKSHPEYFTEEGAGTAQAKAAILRIMTESITAGIAAAEKDGVSIPPPENLNSILKNAYDDISVNLNPSIPEGEAKPAGSRTHVITIHGHPMKFTVTGGGNQADDLNGTFDNLHNFYISLYFSNLQHGLLVAKE